MECKSQEWNELRGMSYSISANKDRKGTRLIDRRFKLTNRKRNQTSSTRRLRILTPTLDSMSGRAYRLSIGYRIHTSLLEIKSNILFLYHFFTSLKACRKSSYKEGG